MSEEKQIHEVLLTQNKRDAEIKELIKWKSRGVYTEINDKGQNCTCPRQFIKFTIMNDKPGMSAHLCARRFEEGKNLRTESPTCLRKWVKCMFNLIASKKIANQSHGYETAFFQGKELERTVLVHPSAETSK